MLGSGGMANVWLFLVLLVIALMTALLYMKRPMKTAEGFDEQTEFIKQQDTYFHKTAPDGIPVDPGLQTLLQTSPSMNVNTAMQTPGLNMEPSTTDYTSLFYANPIAKYAEDDAKFCRGVKHPRNLPAIPDGSRIGCGWYFVPNDIGASVGVLGTRDGPVIRNGLPPGGTWIWNRAEAAKQEDIKICKRITVCESVEADAFKGVCGFCERLGHAVPINSDGSEKYPDEADACGGATLTSANACATAQLPYTTPDGFACGTAGHASEDGALRLYTAQECDAFGGVLQANGVCKRPDGTSISYDCRILNVPANVRIASSGDVPTVDNTNLCMPIGGKLSANCLAALAKSAGLTMNGAILKLIYGYKQLDSTDRLAIQRLATVGTPVPQEILGGGAITVQSATNAYTAIYRTMTNPTPNVQEAAKWLCIGTANFDPCDFQDSDGGPFSTVCLQQAFRKAGCQAAGSMYPTEQMAAQYATMSWGDINARFTDLVGKMKSDKASVQDAAVRQCLGMKYNRAPPLPCNNPGMEYLYYSWGDAVATPYGPMAAYMGRIMSDRGFQSIEPGGSMIAAAQRATGVVVKIRGYVNAPMDIAGSLQTFSDDGVRVYLNKQAVINNWSDHSTAQDSADVTFPKNKRVDVELHWYQNGGGAVLDSRGVMDTIRPYLYMPFPKTAPIVAFDFFTGSFQDLHGTVRSAKYGLTTSAEPASGRVGAAFGSRAFLQVLTPIRTRAVKTYTMSVYWKGLNVQAPVLFNLCKNNTGRNGANFGLYGGDAQADTIRFSYYRNKPDGYDVLANGNVSQVGRWIHYAVVWDSDFAGAKVYVDGVLRASNRNAGLFGGAAFPDDLLNYIAIGRPASIAGNTAENDVYTYSFGDNVPGSNNMYVIVQEKASGRRLQSNIPAGMRYLNYGGTVYLYTEAGIWYAGNGALWNTVRANYFINMLNAAVLNEGAIESPNALNGIVEYFHMYDRCLNISEIMDEKNNYVTNYRNAVDTYGSDVTPTFVDGSNNAVYGNQF